MPRLPLETVGAWQDHVQRWPTNASHDWAARAFPQLCADPRVLAVVLLGSTIRPAESSYDFDCLYIFQGERPAFPRHPTDVDIRGIDAREVDNLVAGGHDLLVWSLQLGQLVCERDHFWSRLRDSWLSRLPFPSATVADERAKKAETLLVDLQSIGDEDAATEQLVTMLTHRARAALLRDNVFPASRPELPGQLREAGHSELATILETAIRRRSTAAQQNLLSAPRGSDAA